MSERVCAVVVTYNRKALLDECLCALRAQSRTLDGILIVDNASTDGTAAMLEERGHRADPRVHYLRLEQNLGGAGGFHRAFADAYAAGFDWIWAMDDDTIVDQDALEQLFAARAS
ncbi:MAG TPA: glycosyltransferase, partial [Chthoniobacterales bacterium]